MTASHCSLMHKKSVGRTSQSSVIKPCPYSSAFVSYSVRRRRIRRIRRRYAENAMNAWKMGYDCLWYSAHFLLDSSVRPLFALEHCITVYNNHHHPYIDSTATTVLSDTWTLYKKNTGCWMMHLPRWCRMKSGVMHYAVVTE